jgi:hypothetical protein
MELWLMWLISYAVTFLFCGGLVGAFSAYIVCITCVPENKEGVVYAAAAPVAAAPAAAASSIIEVSL